MYTRVSNFPGRVRMVEVPGQPGYFDMTRADNPTEPGTPMTAETFLKDATAALFGLGPAALPDDALQAIAELFRKVTPIIGTYIGVGENVATERTIDFGVDIRAMLLIPHECQTQYSDPKLLFPEAPNTNADYARLKLDTSTGTYRSIIVKRAMNSGTADKPYRYMIWPL